MTDVTSYLKIYTLEQHPQLAEINRREICRYSGLIGRAMGEEKFFTEDESVLADIMEECINEAMPVFTYKVSYRKEDIKWLNGKPNFSFEYEESKNLSAILKDCSEVIFFAATVGLGIDRLITKYNRISPVKALFLQAIGAERIECLCNLFNSEINSEYKSNGKFTKPRYSPGYGDLKISMQKDLMQILDCNKRLGITLNESMLMSPSKSVTAIIGTGTSSGNTSCEEYRNPEHRCSECSKTDCEYRDK